MVDSCVVFNWILLCEQFAVEVWCLYLFLNCYLYTFGNSNVLILRLLAGCQAPFAREDKEKSISIVWLWYRWVVEGTMFFLWWLVFQYWICVNYLQIMSLLVELFMGMNYSPASSLSTHVFSKCLIRLILASSFFMSMIRSLFIWKNSIFDW